MDAVMQILKWAVVVVLVATGVGAMVAAVTFVASSLAGYEILTGVELYGLWGAPNILGILNPTGSPNTDPGGIGYAVIHLGLMLPAFWIGQWIWKAVKYVLST